MVLYNVTVSIDESIHEDWLEWMRSTHIPDVMATGCFIESRISRVRGKEENEFTFAITYLSPSQEKLDEYNEKHATHLQSEHASKYNGKFAAFRTLLTVLDEFKS